MKIVLPISGFDTYVPPLQSGWFLLVEGGPEPDKEFFLDTLARAMHGAGFPLTFFTTRDAAAMGDRVPDATIHEVQDWAEFSRRVPAAGATFAESLSAMANSASTEDLAASVRAWRTAAQKGQGLFVASVEPGMLPADQTHLLRHFADAIIQFRVSEDADTVQTFLRIPRWGARLSVPQPIHYQFTGDRLALDTRRRHV